MIAWQTPSVSGTEADSPLWSERGGGSLPLSREGFNLLLTKALATCVELGLFREVLDLHPGARRFPSRGWETADEFFTLKLGDPWGSRRIRDGDFLNFGNDDQDFDLIELLHRDVVSIHVAGDNFDREAGARSFAK